MNAEVTKPNGKAIPVDQGEVNMGLRREDSELVEVVRDLKDVLSKTPQPSNKPVWISAFIAIGVCALGYTVSGVSFGARTEAELRKDNAALIVRVEQLEKRLDDETRTRAIQDKLLDEYNRDLEIKLAARGIIRPGPTR